MYGKPSDVQVKIGKNSSSIFFTNRFFLNANTATYEISNRRFNILCLKCNMPMFSILRVFLHLKKRTNENMFFIFVTARKLKQIA